MTPSGSTGYLLDIFIDTNKLFSIRSRIFHRSGNS